jgi:hypothetical protein
MRKVPCYIMFILLSAVMLSCEKETTWDIQPSPTFPVVDCIITNEMKTQELRLYMSSEGLNQQPLPVSGAVIALNDGTSSMTFTEDTSEAGRYISSEPFMASAGNIYTLTIAWGNICDTAFAGMVAITPLETFQIAVYDSLFRFVYHGSSKPSMTEVFYDWSAVPEYCESFGSDKASEVFYTLDNLDVSLLFAPERLVVPFPRNTLIIRRKYSLSEAHQRFLRSLLLETDWRGGLFDVEQGNVPTNFRHGIRGWFAACMVLSDTTLYK